MAQAAASRSPGHAMCPSPVHSGRAGRYCGFEMSPDAEKEGGEAALFEEEEQRGLLA